MTSQWRTDASFGIRASRARPPGAAGLDRERGATYAAALEQFDEFMTAARTTTAATRPLPLFYALSQAGRAIAAAHGGERWRLRLHGMQCPDLINEVLDVEVVRAPVTDQEDALDAFTGVEAATRGQGFSNPVSVGALWASLPEIAP